MDSTIEGRAAALVANDRAVIRYENTTLRGAVQAQGSARIEGDDGGAASTAPPVGGRIRIGAGGVRMEGADDSEIRIVPGGIRLEPGADPGADLAPDAEWREAGGAWAAPEDPIAELGGRVDAEGALHLVLAGGVLFDFASEVVRPEAAEQLARVAQLIRASAVGAVTVVGYTDSVGDDRVNQRLSERRAASVMRWLRDREGIPEALLSSEGLGESRPIAHETRPDGSDDPEGRARNRRVEVRFLASR